ncbi:MAG TPA: OsmC family protein [Candidatus Bathyarchaeia archaeon]|nr:OsmC family protein [Candidatus Bathyarchaeia archaeon]
MKANAVWVEGYKSIVDNGRGHTVTVDLTLDQGGKDAGPTALELAVMALAGCATTIFKIIATKRKFNYESLQIELNAEKPKDASTVTEVKGHVEIITAGTEQEVRTILKSTFSTCPVGVIFEKAGIIPTYDLTIRKTTAA